MAFFFFFFTGVNNIRTEESKVICTGDVMNKYFIRFGSVRIGTIIDSEDIDSSGHS